MPRYPALPTRFSANYIPEPNSGCWLWAAFIRPDGYGCIKHSRKTIMAHRAAWIVYYGEIPNGMNVLHKCDVRCCVNPDHLWLGTDRDNVVDMEAKGRGVRIFGSRHVNSKLTEAQVSAIRDDCRAYTIIAGEYGISPQTVCKIKVRRTWRHIP